MMSASTNLHWALICRIITVGMLGLILGLPTGTLATQISSPTAQQETSFRDPMGRFEVPIPTNWTVEEHDGFITIVTDDKKIAISLAIVDRTSATDAIAIAAGRIGGEVISLESSIATPVADGDDVAYISLDDGVESGHLLQALAQRVNDVVFVLVLFGDYETVGLRQIQVDKILTGVQIFPDALGTPITGANE